MVLELRNYEKIELCEQIRSIIGCILYSWFCPSSHAVLGKDVRYVRSAVPLCSVLNGRPYLRATL